jgi:hypothetical protein
MFRFMPRHYDNPNQKLVIKIFRLLNLVTKNFDHQKEWLISILIDETNTFVTLFSTFELN